MLRTVNTNEVHNYGTEEKEVFDGARLAKSAPAFY